MQRTGTRLAIVLLALSTFGCSDGDPVDDGYQYPHTNACLGSEDEAILDIRFVDAGPPDPMANNPGDIVQGCAMSDCIPVILDQGDIEGCVSECLATTELAGLTTECEDCWIGLVLCGQEHCVAPCLGSNDQLCDDCVIDNCYSGLEECTGIPNLTDS